MGLEATMATYKYSAGTVKDVFAWLNGLGSNNEHVARLKAKYKNAGVKKLQGTVYVVIDDSDRTLAGIEVTPVDWQQEKVKKPVAPGALAANLGGRCRGPGPITNSPPTLEPSCLLLGKEPFLRFPYHPRQTPAG